MTNFQADLSPNEQAVFAHIGDHGISLRAPLCQVLTTRQRGCDLTPGYMSGKSGRSHKSRGMRDSQDLPQLFRVTNSAHSGDGGTR